MKQIILALTLFVSLNRVLAQDREALAKNPALFLATAVKGFGWNEPREPFHLGGNLYFVGTRGLTSWLITGPEGHLLLFTGMPESGKMIEASIRKLGFNPKDIKWILTCHAHVDHVGGHAYLQQISGAKIALMAEEKAVMESGGKTDFHYAGVPGFDFAPVKVDRLLKDGDSIVSGAVSLKAMHTPGHSPGSTTWQMNLAVDGQNYLVVFPDGTGINPGFHLTKPASYPGMGENYQRSLDRLAALHPDIWLSSHSAAMNFDAKSARSATEGIKAWIDPAGYQQFISAEREKFDAEISYEKSNPKKRP